MDVILFLIPACGLLFSVSGALAIVSAVRAGRARVGESDPSAMAESAARSILRCRRISGLFWLCVGCSTIWFSGFLTSWDVTSVEFVWTLVGLIWAGIGAWQILSTFRRSRQAAVAHAAKCLATKPSARRAQLIGGFAALAGGAAMLSLSGIHVGAAPSVQPVSPPTDNRLVEIVTQHARQAFDQQAHIGLMIGAIAGDEEVLLGFGARQLGDSQPPDADTVFEIGSISKAFTGILLAQSVENGDLELDDRVADLLPDGWSLSESAKDVTLQHCTTHTSGFPRLPGNLLGVTEVFRDHFGGDPYRDYREEQFREALASVDLEFEPGADRSYSNFAVGLLGFVLATRNGSDYDTLLKTRICQPLGMERTTTVADAWQQEHMATKYRSVLRLGPMAFALDSDDWRLPNHLAGAGAIRSTGRDMLTFLKANMGRIETPIDPAIRRSHQQLFEESPDQTMGMNWIRSYKDGVSQNVIWHNGGTGGFRTWLGFTEDHQFGVFVLANTRHDVGDIGNGLVAALVREYAPDSRKPVTEHGYAKVAPYTGIRWENDRPVVEVHDRWSPLVSIDGIPIEQIMDFARQEFGDKARKRLAEDLVELLSKMGHDPQWVVTLGLETDDGQIEHQEIEMTAENRNRVRE